MLKHIQVQVLNNPSPENTMNLEIEFPKKCPLCGVAVEATHIHSSFNGNYASAYSNVFSTFFCPACEQCFIGFYRLNQYGKICLFGFEPRNNLEKRIFTDNISLLSPDFCRIYNQAYAAQQQSLNDIAGISYRKALEFLIKDYAIFFYPDDSEKIKNMMLSQCINTYIDNRRIKRLATASAWIGNDETHYTRKLEEYSTTDLIAFINAIVSFIDSDISSMQAEQIIEDVKKSKA